MRVDELPGASKSHLTAGISEETHKAGFGPSTFVPREKRDGEDAQGSLFSTTSTVYILQGATEMEVASQTGFRIGQLVDIAPGTNVHEVKKITAFGWGIAFDSPLQFAHAAGSQMIAKDVYVKCGFRVGDPVIWTRADSEVPRGTEGKVIELPDDDEDETVTVIFPATTATLDHGNPPPPIRKELPSQELKMVEVDKAGSRPWKVFCGATSLLAILWWMTGMLVAMELHGQKFLVVSPLTRDEEADIVRTARPPSFLQFGHELVTKWPHENIHTLGLACNGGSGKVVASSQFALYAADLGADTEGHHVEFKAAPECQDIEGESLQDVSLQCGSHGGACQAVVLTQQGRQLVKCDIAKSSKKVAFLENSRKPSVALIAEEWLNDGDAGDNAPAESVRSLSMSSRCEGDVRDCAYVGTSGDRIVEMQQPANSEVSHKYVPHRLLQAKLNGTSGGSMDVIHDRYLGLLQEDGQHLQVLDLKNGGAVVNSWQIPKPPKHQSWSAMCATGDNLYFFSEGHSPQLWRFPVPEQLRPEAVAKAPQQSATSGNAPRHSLLHAGGGVESAPSTDTANTAGHSLLQTRRKHSRTQTHVSLDVSPIGDSSEPPSQADSPAPQFKLRR